MQEHTFPDFSLTTLKFPDLFSRFSRFSRCVATLSHVTSCSIRHLSLRAAKTIHHASSTYETTIVWCFTNQFIRCQKSQIESEYYYYYYSNEIVVLNKWPMYQQILSTPITCLHHLCTMHTHYQLQTNTLRFCLTGILFCS